MGSGSMFGNGREQGMGHRVRDSFWNRRRSTRADVASGQHRYIDSLFTT